MDEPLLLPHLTAACRNLLGGEEMSEIPPPVRSHVAQRAGVGQWTVDRFLKDENVPKELDRVVTAVAAVADKDWTIPWQEAVDRATDAKVEWEQYLTGQRSIAPDPAE
jgi:hypothetical protein